MNTFPLVLLALFLCTAPVSGFSGAGNLPSSFSSTRSQRRRHCEQQRLGLSKKQSDQSSSSSSFNPFTSMVSDIASSILGKSLGSQPQVDAALSKLNEVPSWDDVRSKLESMQTEEERSFRKNLEKGYGVGSPLHKLRLFDSSNKEEDVRVTFFRDSASWCPYCQKVWLALEEKRIPYIIEKVNMRCYGDKPNSFLRMQPSGQIPVAIIDGKVYGQSNDILYALDELFPNHKSLQPAKNQQQRGQQLLRLERQVFGAWMYWLTTAGGDSLRNSFVETLNQVENELRKGGGGPFFMGKEISIVDVMFASFLERMAASLIFYKGFVMRVPPGTKTDYPSINRWFDAMETLPSYQLTKSDYYTHCWDLPPQLGGCVTEAAGVPYQKAINGERTLDGHQGSWELPLQPHNGGVEPDWGWSCGGNEMASRREAVERVSGNHDAIVRFASRGAGKKGMPPVSAPLADPNAIPSESTQEAVNAIMKLVCMGLLEGTEKTNDYIDEVAKIIVRDGDREYVEGVMACIIYVRDRIGVPRDMQLPAARQLRAYLNWSLGRLIKAKEAS